MNNERNIRMIAVVTTVMFFLSLITLGYFLEVNKKKGADLDHERLQNEKLLSEKLELDKEIKNFRNEMSSLLGKNKELDKLLMEVNEKIKTKENAIKRLTKENASLEDMKKEYEAIRIIRDELNDRIRELNLKNTDLTVEVEILKDRIAELSNDNDRLTAQLKDYENNGLVDQKAGNFRIETQKKRNNKLTVKSSKTYLLELSFNMPEEYAGKVDTEHFRIVLQNPNGGSIQGDQKTTFSTEMVKLSAGNEPAIAPLTCDRVNINFRPAEKLREGIYTIILYEGNYITGTAQVRLI